MGSADIRDDSSQRYAGEGNIGKATETTVPSCRHLWLPETGAPLLTKDIYALSPGESLVAVHYSGINPADIKHRSLGCFNQVPGYDFSGMVIATTPGSEFPAGTLVGGSAPAGIGRKRAHGAHQDLLVAVNDMLFALPSGMSLVEAAAMGIPLRTAITALHNKIGVPLPWEPSLPRGQGILIWGGGAQVGGWAIQVAAAADIYPIYVVASARHHPALIELGASRCFDYSLSDVDIANSLKDHLEPEGSRISRAFDCAGWGSHPGVHNALRCLNILQLLNMDGLRIATVENGGPPQAITVFATPDYDTELIIDGKHVHLAKDEQEGETVLLMIDHALKYWKAGFRIPGTIREINWKAAGGELVRVAEGGGNGMEKVVIKHF